MGRRSFTRELKLEAVRLIRERGVSYAPCAARSRAWKPRKTPDAKPRAAALAPFSAISIATGAAQRAPRTAAMRTLHQSQRTLRRKFKSSLNAIDGPT